MTPPLSPGMRPDAQPQASPESPASILLPPDALPRPVEPAPAAPPPLHAGRAAGQPWLAVAALVVAGAVAAAAVSTGIVLYYNRSPRTNPQTVNLGANVRLTEDSAALQVVDRASPAVVSIITGGDARQPMLASGFLVTSDGYIATTTAALLGSTQLTVLLPGETTARDGRLIDSDCESGLAVIKVDGLSGRPTLAFADPGSVRRGQSVIVLGGQVGGGLARGLVAEDHAEASPRTAAGGPSSLRFLDVVRSALQARPEAVGGPVLNVAGQVIGVSVGSGGSDWLAISASGLQAAIEQLLRDGRFSVASLGATTASQVGPSASAFGLVSGARVLSVDAGGPAERAGLVAGDVITQLDEVHVQAGLTLPQLLRQDFRGGQRVTVTLVRAGVENQVQATLAAGHPVCP